MGLVSYGSLGELVGLGSVLLVVRYYIVVDKWPPSNSEGRGGEGYLETEITEHPVGDIDTSLLCYEFQNT